MQSHSLFGVTVHKTLYMNRGTILTVDSISLPALAWNADTVFSPRSPDILLYPGDSLVLTVTNNDTTSHQFILHSQIWTIPVGQTRIIPFFFPNEGVFPYVDGQSFPTNILMGACGMVVVDGICDGRFYWNIRELEKAKIIDFANGQPVNYQDYRPDYFLVNGISKPQLRNDSTAKVVGNVGDVIHIYVANHGLSQHSMHFHGYHVQIKWASTGTRKLNWIKDTVPLDEAESMILELIPDKPGIFPVHDHNLLALTGGGYFPNGIFIMMEIQ